ncbi:MAG: heparinase II/III family protein [Firmicutes bacterium]|nr:heparinase II/III family protein [Bacillota bacterium]
MRVVSINQAEAIIEPFWDGGSSEHPDNKNSLLGQYKVTVDDGAKGQVRQTWCAVEVVIEKSEPGKTAIVMERKCDIDIGGYDIFRVFASIPSWVCMTVVGRVDGKMQNFIEKVTGRDNTDEYDGDIRGRWLTEVRLEFSMIGNQPAVISLLWLGLSNREEQNKMEARKSPYTPDWPGCLREQSGQPIPQIGIFFDAKDLEELRRRVKAGPLKKIYDEIRKQALADMELNPEDEIGTYIPKPDRRWCRNRDMKLTCTAGKMERLALVGLIDENMEMSRMAARMALSAAHCEYWCESIMGVFPGATWHHRSFTEEIYCTACALVLDWAGFCITPHGKQIIQDAIIMKGLPRIESDFKRMEYIRSMNQGIVFSSGRILGLLSLIPEYPRYKSLIEEAEQDLHDMVNAYIQEDGGTLEGVSYWNYTFSTAIPIFYTLSRFRNKSFKDYIPPSIAKTGDYALSMLSIAGNGTSYLPINDAHADKSLALSLVGAYCHISDKNEWKALYGRMLQSGTIEPDIYALIFSLPPEEYEGCDFQYPQWKLLPVTGQVGVIRTDSRLGNIHFHFCSGPTYGGHYHQDKGSFILEVEGESLAIDRGVTRYDHPETALIQFAGRHNLLYPESPDGTLIRQPGNAPGGKLTCALEVEEIVMLTSDNKKAWEKGLFDVNIRRVFSPTPNLYIFDDELIISTAMPVSFRVNSRGSMRDRGEEVWIEGSKAFLRIIPVNWIPEEVTMEPEGIDSHEHPVNLLRMLSRAKTSHRLLTAIEVVPGGLEPEWRIERENHWTFCRRDEEVAIAITPDGKLECNISKQGKRVFSAIAKAGEWIQTL